MGRASQTYPRPGQDRTRQPSHAVRGLQVPAQAYQADRVTSDPPPPQVWPTLRARDARALIRFLVDVLGFQETVVYAEGDLVSHAELAWPPGGGVMLGSVRDDELRTMQPGTFAAYVVTDEPEALYRRAVEAGAEIARELYTTDYGSRDFAVRDAVSNQWATRWSFGAYRGEPQRSEPQRGEPQRP